MNQLLSICGIWLILDVIALELISRRKNGIEDICDLYEDVKRLYSMASKIYVIFHLILLLPFTIPASIYKIIKQKKND